MEPIGQIKTEVDTQTTDFIIYQLSRMQGMSQKEIEKRVGMDCSDLEKRFLTPLLNTGIQ